MADYRKYHIYLTILWIGLGGFVFVYSFLELGIGEIHNPGAGLMPFGLGILFFLLSLYKLVRRDLSGSEKKNTQQGEVSIKNTPRLALSMVAVFGYALLLETLGFLLTTFLTMVLLFRSAGYKKWMIITVYSFITVLVTYFLFTYLGLRLPLGILRILRFN
jgi:putative tricarboxylic transport membrane protein